MLSNSFHRDIPLARTLLRMYAPARPYSSEFSLCIVDFRAEATSRTSVTPHSYLHTGTAVLIAGTEVDVRPLPHGAQRKKKKANYICESVRLRLPGGLLLAYMYTYTGRQGYISVMHACGNDASVQRGQVLYWTSTRQRIKLSFASCPQQRAFLICPTHPCRWL